VGCVAVARLKALDFGDHIPGFLELKFAATVLLINLAAYNLFFNGITA